MDLSSVLPHLESQTVLNSAATMEQQLSCSGRRCKLVRFIIKKKVYFGGRWFERFPQTGLGHCLQPHFGSCLSFCRSLGQPHYLSWLLFVSYHFIVNLYRTKSVIEALKLGIA